MIHKNDYSPSMYMRQQQILQSQHFLFPINSPKKSSSKQLVNVVNKGSGFKINLNFSKKKEAMFADQQNLNSARGPTTQNEGLKTQIKAKLNRSLDDDSMEISSNNSSFVVT